MKTILALLPLLLFFGGCATSSHERRVVSVTPKTEDVQRTVSQSRKKADAMSQTAQATSLKAKEAKELAEKIDEQGAAPRSAETTRMSSLISSVYGDVGVMFLASQELREELIRGEREVSVLEAQIAQVTKELKQTIEDFNQVVIAKQAAEKKAAIEADRADRWRRWTWILAGVVLLLGGGIYLILKFRISFPFL